MRVESARAMNPKEMREIERKMKRNLVRLRQGRLARGLFVPMVKLLPEGQKGLASIKHFEVDEKFSILSSLRREPVDPGKYCKLEVGHELMMTDTQMEQRTNAEFVRRAHGNVLIAGLGIGMIVAATIDKPEVRSITVVEKYQDVIDLVSPHFPGIDCVCADIRSWRPATERRFNTIYFDIWPSICGDNLVEIYALERAFRKYLDRSDPDRWMASWQKAHLQQVERDWKKSVASRRCFGTAREYM